MLKNDTPLPENAQTPKDPNQTGAGHAGSPGGSSAPAKTTEELSHGQETYPGGRKGGEVRGTKATPDAGDVDPGSRKEAEKSGQDGDPDGQGKNTGNAWNG